MKVGFFVLLINLLIINHVFSQENDKNRHLLQVLDKVYQEDQMGRRRLKEIKEKFGENSNEMKDHWKLIDYKDSINLLKVVRILDTDGWPGVDIIGDKGSKTIFLVIQHSNLSIQTKYLPLMREAVNNGDAKVSHLAMLEDRVALRLGKKQIYGSQVGFDEKTGEYFVLPLVNPGYVDERRAKIGLSNLQSYVDSWGIKWEVEKHIKRHN